jgi:tryptophan-rich hypothetical protein
MARVNQINPRKLLNSKWTAVNPARKEKHFLVTDIAFDEDGAVLHCLIEAVISHRSEQIDWRELKDGEQWLQGWK